MPLEIKLQNQNGEVKVLGRTASFSATADSINLNFGINLGVQFNRLTKVETLLTYDNIEIPDTVTIGELKALLKSTATELDISI